ncbi:MAG: SRPBCC family protein [Gaiellaceae bacterium]
MDVNRNAPVVAATEIDVAATPEAVWDVLTDIESWPRWNPDVKSMSLQGGLTKGSVFRWRAGPGTITSTIQRVEPPKLIAWTGTTLGIKAKHVYRLEPRGEATLVQTEESYEGLVARLLRGSLQKTLENGLSDGLRYLKAETERRSA